MENQPVVHQHHEWIGIGQRVVRPPLPPRCARDPLIPAPARSRAMYRGATIASDAACDDAPIQPESRDESAVMGVAAAMSTNVIRPFPACSLRSPAAVG